MLLIAVALILAVALSSCNNRTRIVEYPNGQRVVVEETQAYEVGDTVYVQEGSSSRAQSYIISKSYWKDTTVYWLLKNDVIVWEYKKGVIIK